MTYEQYQKTKHFPALDGIRAISILLVITVHLYYDNFSWTWLSGGAGVQLFFVLSGFLITMLAIREERKNGALSLKAFYIRRSFRIFPLYFLVLGLYAFLILGLGFGGEYDFSRFSAALPYYLLYVNEFAPGAPFYQSWSLGIEEKFYLVWPFLAFVLCRTFRWNRILLTEFLIVSFVGLHQLLPKGGLLHYHTILIGCFLAIVMENPATFEKLRVLGSRAATVAIVLFFVANQLLLAQLPWTSYCYPFTAGLLVLNCMYAPSVALSWRPLTFVGERAYGIYLVHILCIRSVKFIFPSATTSLWVSIGGFVAATLLSLVVAGLLYRFIETPCIKLGRKLASKRLTSRETEAAEPQLELARQKI